RAAARAVAAPQCGIRAARLHGGRLVADFTAMGRSGGACAALSPRPRTLRRPRAAGLDALARGGGRSLLAGTGDAAGALERADLSAQGGRLRGARRAEGASARRGAARSRGGLDRRWLS